MPDYIVKPSRDEDFYVLWSDITESPHVWGPKAEVIRDCWHEPRAAAPDRFDRADANGSSAMPGSEVEGFYWWDDDVFIYQQLGILRRRNVKELCRRLVDKEPVDDLLEPFEDDE